MVGSSMYNKKTVIWNHKEEITVYKHSILQNNESLSGEVVSSNVPSVKQSRTKYDDMDIRSKVLSDKKRKQYYTKRVSYLIDLAIHNKLDSFITLTFRDEVTTYEEARYYWELFLKRLRYYYNEKLNKELKYIAVHELQTKRGHVYHFHVLIHGYIPFSELENMWAMGFVSINHIKGDNSAQVAYCFKYIFKDLKDERTLKNRESGRKIFCSRNMEKPVISKVMSDDTFEDIVFANLESDIETYTYNLHNHRNEVINEADCLRINKKINY